MNINYTVISIYIYLKLKIFSKVVGTPWSQYKIFAHVKRNPAICLDEYSIYLYRVETEDQDIPRESGWNPVEGNLSDIIIKLLLPFNSA